MTWKKGVPTFLGREEGRDALHFGEPFKAGRNDLGQLAKPINFKTGATKRGGEGGKGSGSKENEKK